MTAQSGSIPLSGPQIQPRGLSPAALIAGYASLCLLPLVLAFVLALVHGHEPRGLFRELSGGLIMVAYVMMLAQFVLSGRFESVSGRAGIDRTMRFHQVAGWVILGAVILHPLLYAAPRLWPNPLDAVTQVHRMFGSAGLRTGVIAWWLTVLLVPLAVWRDRLPFGYEIWRLSHGLFAIAIALFATHHTLRVGTHSADRWLATFWALATAAAILCMVYIYIAKPLMKRTMPYRLLSNRKVADRTWELTLAPERGQPLAFAAGQFAWLNLGHSPFSLTEHPFSISSTPADGPRISFTIKESGDFTNRIGTVAPGTRAYLDGPYGIFSLSGRQAKGIVFIAGGVGFAPIMGILRQLQGDGYQHPLRLIYGNRVETQILYRDEIERLRESLDLTVHHVLSEPPGDWTGLVGELTPDILEQCLAPLSGDWLYFVCGPPAMINAVERALHDRGVPDSRIVAERFRYN